MANSYSITDLCLALGVPRNSYYAWRQRPAGPRARDNARLREQIGRLFVEHRRVYGSPRLTALLRQQGVCCSRKRVARHMRALGIGAQQKRAFRPRTTHSRHDHPIAPNRLNHQILPSMSGAGHCYDNAAMESFWSTLKTEALHSLQLHSAYDARQVLFDYIETFYNPKRLHSSLDYRSPNQYEHDITHRNASSLL